MSIPMITIFYYILENDKILKEEDLDFFDKSLDSVMRNCIMNGYKVKNYQDHNYNAYLEWS